MNPTEPVSRREALELLGAVVGVGAASSEATTATGQETDDGWPMFGYTPANTSHAPGNRGPAETVEKQWGFETAKGVTSSPAVADGTVYVGSGDNNVYALSAADGTEQWTYETDGAIASSPAVAGETVYIGSRDDTVYALSAADGTERWTYETGGGVFSSPTVVDGTVYVGSRDSILYALSAADGTERWTYTTNAEIWSSPAVKGGAVYVGARDNRVYALSAADGAEQWTYDTGGWVESSPAVDGDAVYVGSLDQHVYALSAADGTERWRVELSDVVASSPAVADGTVYVGSKDNTVYALSAADGTEQWAYETGDRVFSSPSVVDDTVYVGSADRTVYALSAADGAERWTYETGDGVFSSPAVAGETVYIGSNDATVYGLGAPADGGISQFLPVLLGVLGLGGGGAWWAYRRSSTGGGDEETGTGTDAPVPPSVTEPTDPGVSDAAPEMVPERIPTTPGMSVDYDALVDETPIGSGGNADVTRATLPTGDGDVHLAIKKPRLSGTLHVEAIEGILTEAETWSSIDDHDHIVDVVDYGSEPLPWIAMEYMDGGHLGERMDGIGTDQAVWTALAVTKGVHHAHREGIAHLDLKPENVLFRTVEGAWDVPKVSDWGLAKHLLDHSKSVEGLSPQYAAPEQFSDEYGRADDITDVYQLGTLFYELFTGRPPFEGTPTKVMRAVLDEQPRPPSEVADVPPALDDVLLTALAKEKADRYDSLVYLRDELQDLYEEWV